MQIELPQDLFDRVQRRASMLHALSGVDVIRKAMDSLDCETSILLAYEARSPTSGTR